MKHTPGPWSYTDSNFDGNDIKLAPYDTRFVIQCETDFKGVKGVIGACGYRLNAQLISAAPDLLEACKNVVNWHREHDSGEGELFGLDFVTTCINAVRKAEPDFKLK